MIHARFRFYAELNNFLTPVQRWRSVRHACSRETTVKHMIEALGVPHTEVDLILVNSESAGFSYRLLEGDTINVYPAFRALDVQPSVLRPPLVPPIRFIADAHLGQLARNLRMLGFDVLYRNDYPDAEVACIAAAEGRVVLTRDRDLLIRREIRYGCYLHSLLADEQAVEVLARFRLADAARAFSRCLGCNGLLRQVERGFVEHRIPAHSREHYDIFYECESCAQVYWEGSHVKRMRLRVARMLGK